MWDMNIEKTMESHQMKDSVQLNGETQEQEDCRSDLPNCSPNQNSTSDVTGGTTGAKNKTTTTAAREPKRKSTCMWPTLNFSTKKAGYPLIPELAK